MEIYFTYKLLSDKLNNMSDKNLNISQIIYNALPFKYIMNFINLDMDILYKVSKK